MAALAGAVEAAARPVARDLLALRPGPGELLLLECRLELREVLRLRQHARLGAVGNQGPQSRRHRGCSPIRTVGSPWKIARRPRSHQRCRRGPRDVGIARLEVGHAMVGAAKTRYARSRRTRAHRVIAADRAASRSERSGMAATAHEGRRGGRAARRRGAGPRCTIRGLPVLGAGTSRDTRC